MKSNTKIKRVVACRPTKSQARWVASKLLQRNPNFFSDKRITDADRFYIMGVMWWGAFGYNMRPKT